MKDYDTFRWMIRSADHGDTNYTDTIHVPKIEVGVVETDDDESWRMCNAKGFDHLQKRVYL